MLEILWWMLGILCFLSYFSTIGILSESYSREKTKRAATIFLTSFLWAPLGWLVLIGWAVWECDLVTNVRAAFKQVMQ